MSFFFVVYFPPILEILIIIFPRLLFLCTGPFSLRPASPSSLPVPPLPPLCPPLTPQTWNLENLKLKAGIHEAQGHRQTMEDKHTIIGSAKEKFSGLLKGDVPDVSFIGLFDGMWIRDGRRKKRT
jgi:hypothetical protein